LRQPTGPTARSGSAADTRPAYADSRVVCGFRVVDFWRCDIHAVYLCSGRCAPLPRHAQAVRPLRPERPDDRPPTRRLDLQPLLPAGGTVRRRVRWVRPARQPHQAKERRSRGPDLLRLREDTRSRMRPVRCHRTRACRSQGRRSCLQKLLPRPGTHLREVRPAPPDIEARRERRTRALRNLSGYRRCLFRLRSFPQRQARPAGGRSLPLQQLPSSPPAQVRRLRPHGP
jgi:hypothetical protein